ncbi:MAG: amidohydrolase family protein [Candidatus Cloacimonetes bacterium]|nr:amidohydrolase family protein [Candidatus Cloacimonadota bacterium]
MKLFHNAYLWQNGGFSPSKKSIVTHDGLIELIVTEPHPPLLAIKNKLDMKGAYVYPGFTDTHTHSFEGGLYAMGIDLSKVKSIPDLLALIHDKYAQTTGTDPIFAWQFDEYYVKEARFPTIAELDHVCHDKPLILRRIDGHSCILNSAARNLVAGLDNYKPEILRGSYNDIAVHHFHGKLSEETILNAYHKASLLAMQGGFTGVHTMIGDASQSISHYKLIRDNLHQFPVKFTLYPQSFNLKAALDVGATRIGGCILADGSIGSSTAALFEPYTNSDKLGNLYQNDEFWTNFITQAHKHNLQVGVHCIGDRAITQINDVYKKLKETDYRDLRHQLIHCELTSDSLIQDIKASGAVPVMQPNFDLLWGGKDGLYDRMMGEDRSHNMNRFASMVRNSIRITGGSDWYISPMDIVQSSRAAMHHHHSRESLTHTQAVDIYTKNAAWLSGEENTLGTIKEGYQADFTVLSHALDDSNRIPQVISVIRNGETVYEA